MSVRAALGAAGVPSAIARAEGPRAEAAMLERHITTQARAEAFLAQVLHESLALRYFEEIASGAAYEGRTDLGNVHTGDGRRYKGRGPIQLTGRANYRLAGHALGLDLEGHPELASRHDVGWRIAAWYWDVHELNVLADHGQFDQITQRINGGQNGAASRRAYLAKLQRVDCRPADPWAGFTESERRWCAEYDRLFVRHLDVDRRRVLRRVMAEQRKRIWKTAQPHDQGGDGKGWEYGHRRERYHALLARSS